MRRLFSMMITGIACLLANHVWAQGVVCKLPADGSWVRYEGTYTQTEIRPELATGQIDIEPWTEHVTIKSVGQETAEYRKADTSCRWIEIKIERGRVRDGKVDTGVTGLEIYKVLIPETAVITDNVDAEGVPVSFLPLVKGYRKVGKAEPKALTEPALQLYPLGILVGYFRELKLVAEDVDPEVGPAIGSIKANQWDGEVTIERPSNQTIQKSSIWKSDEIPFGVAKWKSEMERLTKDAQAPRETFKPMTKVLVEMTAQEMGDDAKSELIEP